MNADPLIAPLYLALLLAYCMWLGAGEMALARRKRERIHGPTPPHRQMLAIAGTAFAIVSSAAILAALIDWVLRAGGLHSKPGGGIDTAFHFRNVEWTVPLATGVCAALVTPLRFLHILRNAEHCDSRSIVLSDLQTGSKK